ncbi:uncharacterized protein LOC128715040 [Anopheles marshallii]|uniref:uncharacterized protein LOC128715040 n=1 Tax=Anopheles marshallii TaxID=1521116 RepID=UPI00237C06C5|nr:uncharacterized protein LOC128715040 [Anopheles marshallii]
MNSHFFPGRTTPETMVGGIRKWEQLSRTSTKRTYVPFDDEFHQPVPEFQRKEDSESEQEQSTEDPGTPEQHYSESEFHTEQEEDSGEEQNKDKNDDDDDWHERGQIRVSQYPPMNIEPDGHLLHIDFIANQLERFELPGSGQSRVHRRTVAGALGSGLSTRKLSGQQQHNISFSRERVREIERTNQILLRRIITTRPTLQTQNSKPVKRSSSTSASPVTSAAANRRKMQERIAVENEILLRKVNSVGSKLSKRTSC